MLCIYLYASITESYGKNIPVLCGSMVDGLCLLEWPRPWILNVWAMNNTERREKRYVGQLWTALQHYEFEDENTVSRATSFPWNKRLISSITRIRRQQYRIRVEIAYGVTGAPLSVSSPCNGTSPENANSSYQTVGRFARPSATSSTRP